jgi:hypothetical protein
MNQTFELRGREAAAQLADFPPAQKRRPANEQRQEGEGGSE